MFRKKTSKGNRIHWREPVRKLGWQFPARLSQCFSKEVGRTNSREFIKIIWRSQQFHHALSVLFASHISRRQEPAWDSLRFVTFIVQSNAFAAVFVNSLSRSGGLIFVYAFIANDDASTDFFSAHRLQVSNSGWGIWSFGIRVWGCASQFCDS